MNCLNCVDGFSIFCLNRIGASLFIDSNVGYADNRKYLPVDSFSANATYGRFESASMRCVKTTIQQR